MMTEIIDNSVQFSVSCLCIIISAVLWVKRRKQAFVILTCYYGALAMGILYWLVYYIITSYTPKIFYVSDLCWVASYLFLLMLVEETACPQEKTFRHKAAWISPIISTALTVFYCRWGDYIENIVSFLKGFN